MDGIPKKRFSFIVLNHFHMVHRCNETLKILLIVLLALELFRNRCLAEEEKEECPLLKGYKFRCISKAACPSSKEETLSECGDDGTGVCCDAISKISPKSCGLRESSSFPVDDGDIFQDSQSIGEPVSKEYRTNNSSESYDDEETGRAAHISDFFHPAYMDFLIPQIAERNLMPHPGLLPRLYKKFRSIDAPEQIVNERRHRAVNRNRNKRHHTARDRLLSSDIQGSLDDMHPNNNSGNYHNLSSSGTQDSSDDLLQTNNSENYRPDRSVVAANGSVTVGYRHLPNISPLTKREMDSLGDGGNMQLIEVVSENAPDTASGRILEPLKQNPVSQNLNVSDEQHVTGESQTQDGKRVTSFATDIASGASISNSPRRTRSFVATKPNLVVGFTSDVVDKKKHYDVEEEVEEGRDNPRWPWSFEVQHAIGGKKETQPWPWIVAIFRQPQNKFFCGGVLIDDRHVLTAAHCFASKWHRNSTYEVLVGRINIDSGVGPRLAVKAVRSHEGFTLTCFCNDISLLTLVKPLGREAVPICLPKVDVAQPGDEVTLLGYGDTKYGGSSTTYLQRVDEMTVFSGEDCRKIFSGIRKKTMPQSFLKQFICAGTEDGSRDACLGDSGGPLLHWDQDGYWSLIGVVSFGYKCGEPGVPGTYSRITYYLPWIDRKIKESLETFH